MADKYRIAHDGPDFVVNYEGGGTVGVYETQQAAMWLHNIDRQAAHDWIREAAD